MKSILVVDNDHSIIRILKRTFEDYDSVFATSGEQAVDILKSIRPDVVLLDISMVGIDGFTTFKAYKDLPHLVNTKTIFISGSGNLPDIYHAYCLGSTDYVRKPFDERELRLKVDAVLQLQTLKNVNNLTSNVHRVVNHLIRNFLNHIHGGVTLLSYDVLDEAVDKEVVKQRIKIIEDGVRDIVRSLDTLNLLSDIETGAYAADFKYYSDRDLKDILGTYVPTGQYVYDAHTLKHVCSSFIEWLGQKLRKVSIEVKSNGFVILLGTSIGCIEDSLLDPYHPNNLVGDNVVSCLGVSTSRCVLRKYGGDISFSGGVFSIYVKDSTTGSL